jgi:molybdate transport system substrate-binding protein
MRRAKSQEEVRGPTACLGAMVFFTALLALGCAKPHPTPALLGVASSLRHVMPVLVQAYGIDTGRWDIEATYGSSGLLARQLTAGAPLDGLVLAGPEPIHRLVRRGDVTTSQPRLVATNRLLLVTHAPESFGGVRFDTLGDLPAHARVAIGDPRMVPAGRYARAALTARGQWRALASRVVLARDVAAALAYVRRGEVDLAVVYATDLRGIDGLTVLDQATDVTPQVVAAVASDTVASATVEAFLGYCSGPQGQAILGRYGFGAVSTTPTTRHARLLR